MLTHACSRPPPIEQPVRAVSGNTLRQSSAPPSHAFPPLHLCMPPVLVARLRPVHAEIRQAFVDQRLKKAPVSEAAIDVAYLNDSLFARLERTVSHHRPRT
jgi:hypothetical protein